jgi:hypothetical protein
MDHEVIPWPSKGRFILWTMNSDHKRCLILWSEFIVYISWSESIKKQFVKGEGLLVGVNRMRTMRDDRAQEVDVLIF